MFFGNALYCTAGLHNNATVPTGYTVYLLFFRVPFCRRLSAVRKFHPTHILARKRTLLMVLEKVLISFFPLVRLFTATNKQLTTTAAAAAAATPSTLQTLQRCQNQIIISNLN